MDEITVIYDDWTYYAVCVRSFKKGSRIILVMDSERDTIGSIGLGPETPFTEDVVLEFLEEWNNEDDE